MDMGADLEPKDMYPWKLLRKYKIGTHAFESEEAKMGSATVHRSAGVVDKEGEKNTRNVRTDLENVETLSKEAVKK